MIVTISKEISADVDGYRCNFSCYWHHCADTFKSYCLFYNREKLEYDFKEKYEDGHRPLRCDRCLADFWSEGIEKSC